MTMGELREELESAIGKFETDESGGSNDQSVEHDQGTVDAGLRETEDARDTGKATQESASIGDKQTGTDGDKTPTDTKIPGDNEQKSDQKGTAQQSDGQADKSKPHRVDRAPISWNNQAKGEWNNLPLHVRQEVHRRDMEVEKVLQETAPIRKIANEYQETVAPYMARINGFGVTPGQAIKQLLSADYALATSNPDKAADLMAKLILDYRIDLSKLDGALTLKMKGGTAPPGAADQQVPEHLVQQIRSQLLQEFAPVLTFAQQQRQQQEQSLQEQQQVAATTVQQMSLDPQFPHFDEVRMDMADIIEMGAKRGLAISPKEAYDKAVLFNPKLSDQLAAMNAHQQAQKSISASSSVTGSPATGGATTVQHDGSIRGALESAFAGIK